MTTHTSSKEIFLLNNASVQFKLDAEVKQHGRTEPTILLYAGNAAKQKYLKNDSNTEMKNVYDLLSGFSAEESKNFIELIIRYEPDYQQFKVLMKFTLSDAFVKKLESVMLEPKLSIDGMHLETFNNPYLDQQASWRNFGKSDKAISIATKDEIWLGYDGCEGLNHFCNSNLSFPTYFHFQYSVKLGWTEFGLKLVGDKVNVLEKLFNEKLFSDCCLVASNKMEVNCHRNIISVHSDVLYTMLTSGLQEAETCKIEMADMGEEGLKALVAYFYQNKVEIEDIGENVALELLQAGHKYNIPHLEATIGSQMYCKPAEWFSIEIVLSLYRFTSNIDELEMLCDKMLNILKKNPKQLRSTEAYLDFLSKHPQSAADLAFHLLEKLVVSV